MVITWHYGVGSSYLPSDLPGDDSELIDIEKYSSEIPAPSGVLVPVEDHVLDAPTSRLIERRSNKKKTDDFPDIIRTPASKRRHIATSAIRHNRTVTSWVWVTGQNPIPDQGPTPSVLLLLSTVVLRS